MARRRDRIPGLGVDAERVVNQVTGDLDGRLSKLERKPGRAGVVTADTPARVGEFLNIEAPSSGLTIIFPEPVPSIRDGRITLCFRNANPVRLVCIGGQVNRSSFVVNTAIGTFEAVCDGLDGWSVETGLSSTGSAVDAEYLLGLAHGSLPNGRVATDSTEIDADLTVTNVVSWALRTASVVFGKLQDLTGLSVLGRAANSTGVMAAITASAARQTLRVNDAGTALEWGHPVEVRNQAGTDVGDAYSLRFNNGTNTAASTGFSAGAATLQINIDDYPLSGLADQSARTVVANATNASAAPTAVQASTARHVFRDNSSNTGLEWGYPIATRANTGTATDGFQLDFINGTHTTASATPSAGGNAFVSFSIDVASLLAAIDSTSIVVSGSTLVRAAVTGAIAIAQNTNTSMFSGIRVNSVATTDRTNLNYLTSSTITANTTDDAGDDEINLFFNVDQTATFTWSGRHNFQQVVTFSSLSGGSLLAAGDNNNVVIGAVNNALFTANATAVLTGMVATADGQMVWVENDDSTDVFTIAHDRTSTAANRFYLPTGQDLTMFARTGMWFRYNGTLQRWVVAGGRAYTGLNIRNGATFHTAVGTFETIEGTGIDITTSGDGTTPLQEVDITIGLAAAAANTFKANVTGSSAVPTDVSLSSFAGSGLTYASGVMDVDFATQAQQEAGSSAVVAVSPSVQQHHPSAAKAWARGTANSTTVLSSYNISSQVDTATGQMTWNISTDFSDGNWCPVISIAGGAVAQSLLVGSVLAGSVRADCRDSGTDALADPGSSWQFVGFGDI